jgi:hypothetical protein
MTRDHHHQFGELQFDPRDKGAGRLRQGLHVQHQNSDLARQQQVPDLVRRGHMPETASTTHGFPQRLQEHLVLREDDQFDDVAGGAEAQGVDGIFVIGG